MKTYVNLLPVSFRRQQLVRARLTQWSAITALGLTIVGTSYAATRHQHLAQVQAESRRRLEYTQVKKMATKVDELKKQIEELQQCETLSLQLSADVPPLAVLGIVSQAAQACAGKIGVQSFGLTHGGGSSRHATTESRLLVLRGWGENNFAVAKFVASLRDVNTFDRVELKSAATDRVGSETRTYVVECGY